MTRKPFPRKGTTKIWGRLPLPEGGSKERSLGTSDEKTARAILKAIESCANSPQQRSIAFRVSKGEVSASEFYDAHQRGELGQLEARLAQPDVDLEPYVERWNLSLTAARDVRAATARKYLRQVRQLIPAGKPFQRSKLSRARIRAFLDLLSERGVTATNRHRAAISSFATWLVEREVLEHNPVSEVRTKREAAPRESHLDRESATKLIEHIASDEARAIHALMCGSGMEISTALPLTHGDVERSTTKVRARGTKNKWRDRTVRVTEDWCWKIVDAWLAAHPGLPQARVFQLDYEDVRNALKDAVEAAGMEAGTYRTHDWRHTYAVQALRDGYNPQVVAHQLGHKDTSMLMKVYGKFVPNDADYDRKQTVRQTVPAETSATSPHIARAS